MSDADLKMMAAQMIMTGFHGMEATSGSDIIKVIRELKPGGIVLFDWDGGQKTYGRNIESPSQLRQLIFDLQQQSDIPLFIAIDQEGGKVCRLKPDTGFQSAVSAQTIGEIDDPQKSRYWSRKIAEDLKSVEVNLNLAPVVDLNINSQSPVIGLLERSFGKNPQKVIRHSRIFAEAMHAEGILCCLKHFPGHGSALTDTHLEFTDISATWQESELEPFQTLIAEDIPDLIMPGHLFNKNLDAEYPASLSNNIINGLLREKLGWQGIVISDDLQMKAIKDNYSLKEAIMLAINAGTDILLFGNNSRYNLYESVSLAIDIIIELIKNNQLTEARIKQSVSRISKLKKKLKFII
ncbi:MAG: glycoside hydrolase family 3 protein [Candidatus Cloacimonetes bacterium]|nr:glycoside hydrolase family 3 protein [Candidatus Cloacimonadota bacterium]